jgi:hypothetical protein
MVAYAFMKLFVPQVEIGLKRHTVRAHRKRHARPGEAVQLYTAMRTKYCRKLVEPDPVCSLVQEIRIEVGDGGAAEQALAGTIEGIEIEGRELSAAEIAAFAAADGFRPRWVLAPPPRGHCYADYVTPRALMGWFWHQVHGPGGFQGVVVRWTPPEGEA